MVVRDVARRAVRDPLWWVIAVLPVLLVVRLSRSADASVVGVGGWLAVVVVALVASGLVAVVLVGMRHGWRLARHGDTGASDRASRRSRSSAVAQLVLGSAVLVLVGAGSVVWLVTSFGR